ncbi:TetR/AcrR family transcriptional regulator [Paenibacillus eucommiae]|uniref:TetR/AcrR family transcriptional repressor of nem operon n=1 Tax=Paenibacillus eucommiae TaxID=1355755 RepID=A0ABS4IXN2_9BACL|nr:TetR/AcrR family transcriptional regulator [Paenibacillus eucommiae]MBP1992348.1 TetR/AcrR family transcriptional repressor of nem operon [Paenibacillus eucommiae]
MTSNKEKIVVAAMDLFHDNGFQATGLEDILTSSGVCKSNFYYHFKSKEELGIQVIERKIRQMREKFLELSLENRELTPKQRILRFFEKMLEFCEEHGCRKGCFFGNLAIELSDHREELRRPISRFFKELEESVHACLAEGCRSGQLKLHGMQPGDLAMPIVSLLEGGLLLAKSHKNSTAMRVNIKLLQFCIED